MYIEDCTVSVAGWNAIDFVAVQYGHMCRNKVTKPGSWGVYVKGGRLVCGRVCTSACVFLCVFVRGVWGVGCGVWGVR
jgi:hypothetical protein